MRRRTLLVSAGAALVAAGCTQPARHPAPDGHPAPDRHPATGGADGRPAVSWRLTGGLTMPGMSEFRPPNLVVYADGLAVTDARFQAQLPPAEVTGLVGELVGWLHDPAVNSPREGGIRVADAPRTEIIVRAADREYRVGVEALDDTRSDHVYRPELYQARDRLGSVYDRVLAGKQAYRASQVRLVVYRADSAEGPAAAWPPGVPVPATSRDQYSGFLDLGGAQAGAVIAYLRPDPELRGNWPVYRTADSRLLHAAWRYLVPAE
jgi:hypothetical protein